MSAMDGSTTSPDGVPPPARNVRSVAVAIRDATRPGALLLVQRPPDDADLPDAWGLPAASLRAGESWVDAARRAGRDKLGVELEVGTERNRGTTRRGDTRLTMRLFEATISRGEPHVPQPVPGVTQYTAWRWGAAAALDDGARRGSLCCRLQLELEGGGTRVGREP
jgi:hypothetical protein